MLQQKYRLKKDFQFRYVYKNGCFVRSPAINLIYVKARHKGIRIGIAVSNKLGKATKRNLIKRRIRESVRAIINKLRPGYDYILVANNNFDFENASFSDISGFVTAVFKKSDLITEG